MKRSILAAVLGFGVATPAWADFNDGSNAYLRRDYARALDEWRPLAEQGHPEAQNNLASMYDKGQGVPLDHVQAYVWFSLAASLYSQDNDRKDAVRNRDLVASKLTPAQVAEAKRQVREWLAKHGKVD